MIPAPMTALVGRQRELDQLVEQLSQRQRLITITGGAGLGKSRLAIAVAREWRARWPDEPACFVRAEDCRTRDDFDRVIAAALSVTARADTIELTLAASPRLLVLDSPEPIISLAAECVARWLAAAPELTVLCASRERLGLMGELVIELDSLSRADAVALLEDRVQRLRPLREDERAALASIVEQVERVPLLIEFAAARMRALSATDLASRLERAIVELSAPSRAVPARQATVEACVRWSYDMLTPAAQRALACCSVFRGSFDPLLAEAVIGGADALEALQVLRDASLLRVAQESSGADLRFSLFAVVARFAEARARELGVLHEARRRLVAHLAERDPRQWLAWFATLSHRESPDRFNRAAAAEYALDAGDDAVELAVDALSARLVVTLEASTLDDTERALATIETLTDRVIRAEPTPEREAIIDAAEMAIADGAIIVGQFERAEVKLRSIERRAAKRDPRWPGFVALMRARIAFLRDDAATTRATLEAALEHFAAVGDRLRCASVEAALSQYKISDDRWTQRSARAEAYAISVNDDALRVSVLTKRLITQFELAMLTEATQTADAIEQIARSSDQREELWLAIAARAGIAHEQCDYAEALRGYTRALEHATTSTARDLSMLRAYRAAAQACLGEHALAIPVFERESATLDRMGDRFYSRLFLGWASASLALSGRVDEARASLDAFELDRWPTSLDGGWPCLFLQRAWLDLADAAQAKTDGDDARAQSAIERAEQRVERWHPAASSDEQREILTREAATSADVRIIRAWLRRAIRARAQLERAASALTVARDGSWFEAPGERRESLAQKTTARAILAVLAAHAADAPSESVSARRLIEAAWPGERMFAHSAKNRLQVAISGLRKAGLSDWIVLRDHGYVLDPSRVVRVVEA